MAGITQALFKQLDATRVELVEALQRQQAQGEDARKELARVRAEAPPHMVAAGVVVVSGKLKGVCRFLFRVSCSRLFYVKLYQKRRPPVPRAISCPTRRLFGFLSNCVRVINDQPAKPLLVPQRGVTRNNKECIPWGLISKRGYGTRSSLATY